MNLPPQTDDGNFSSRLRNCIKESKIINQFHMNACRTWNGPRKQGTVSQRKWTKIINICYFPLK